jgi:DNA repair protein RadC
LKRQEAFVKNKNIVEQNELGLGLSAAAAPAKCYRAPVYRVALVRDGSVTAEATRETADSPAVVAELVRKLIGDSPQEHLVAISLDARSKIIGLHEASRGTLSASLCHSREIFRTSILLNAAGLILSHNHPSGDCTPSPDDRETTRRLARASSIIGIPLVDHVIVTTGPQPDGANKSFYSFREHGLIE